MCRLRRADTARRRRKATLEARVAELEAALAERLTAAEGERLERRLESLALLFEHRVDQIYARLLDVLPELARDGRLDWLAPAGAGLDVSLPLAPGRYGPPLTPHGFRLALGAAVERADGVEILGGRSGIALFGPYRRLPKGRYRIGCALAPSGASTDGGAIDILLEVMDARRDASIGAATASSAPTTIDIEIVIDELLSNPLEVRIHQRGSRAVLIDRITIEPA